MAASSQDHLFRRLLAAKSNQVEGAGRGLKTASVVVVLFCFISKEEHICSSYRKKKTRKEGTLRCGVVMEQPPFR